MDANRVAGRGRRHPSQMHDERHNESTDVLFRRLAKPCRLQEPLDPGQRIFHDNHRETPFSAGETWAVAGPHHLLWLRLRSLAIFVCPVNPDCQEIRNFEDESRWTASAITYDYYGLFGRIMSSDSSLDWVLVCQADRYS